MGIFEQEWNNYENRYRSLMAWGALSGLVEPFSDELIKKGRNLFYNNIPAVLLILEYNLVQTHCYARAKLLAYIMHDPEAEVITAKIDGLKYNPLCVGKYLTGKLGDNYSEHCYVRRKEEDGRVWIYDTSLGLKIEEGLYNDIQNPEITSRSKQPINLEDLDMQRYTLVDVDANEHYIRNVIGAFRDDFKPVRNEYRELIKEELEAIEKSLPDTKEVKQNGKQM